MRRWTAPTLMLTAVFCLWQGAWIEAKAWLAQRLIDHAWELSESTADRLRPWSWADTWPVAKLSVPRLDVQRIILAGVSGRTLAFGPGWAEATALPGDGRSLIAGHRDTHFHFLKQLKLGDSLIVELADGQQLAYEVEETAVVDKREVWLMGTSDDQELLLVTCYPFESINPGGDQRFIVKAAVKTTFPRGEISG